MTLTANLNGEIKGEITVPSGVPTGTVEVRIEGDQGSVATATYTASGTVETTTRRTVKTTTTYWDPLAQTFTLNTGRHIGGVDLWFTARGSSKVYIQIRETTAGFPNKNVIAEAVLKPSAIKVNGTATRITFRPIWLEADVEYALVILTNDSATALSVCEVGKYDSVHKTWVTKQAYQTGVLLSSSNASTWTSHQTMDLTFQLLACRFTETRAEIPLGTLTANTATDVLVLANVERVSANTDAQFVITDETGKTNSINEDQGVPLHSELDGEVSLKTVLRGDSTHSPVLYQGVQLVLGTQRSTADYVTRAITAGTNTTVRVIYDSYTPGNSNVKVYFQQPDSTWTLIPLTEGSPLGDGVEERTHVLTNYNQATVRIKIVLEGNVLYRPYVKSLRVTTV